MSDSEVVNIGINHPAYKVSKRELLEWMNTALNSSVANCDKDVGDGSAYAQVFHSINRRCVPIKQIKWEAKSEYDYTINFNLVQKALKILKVDKAIPAEALMKGKPLDNIEFCQWLKHYHSHVATVEDYDGFAERENVAPGVSRKVKKFAAGDGSAPAKAPTKKAAGMSRPTGTRPMGGSANNVKASPATKASSAPSAQNMAQLKEAEATIAAQKEQLSELNLNTDALTKERDFYFGKLRDVEIMIQEQEEGAENPAFDQIKGILYATDDAEVEDDGL